MEGWSLSENRTGAGAVSHLLAHGHVHAVIDGDDLVEGGVALGGLDVLVRDDKMHVVHVRMVQRQHPDFRVVRQDVLM